jgi:hypothetical protein
MLLKHCLGFCKYGTFSFLHVFHQIDFASTDTEPQLFLSETCFKDKLILITLIPLLPENP